MPKRFFTYLLTIALLSITLMALKRYDPPVSVPDSPGLFNHKALAFANEERKTASLTSLETSDRLQRTIRSYIDTGQLKRSGNLRGVLHHVEQKMPQVHDLAANLVYAKSEQDLVKGLSNWSELRHPKHTHYATWIFRDESARKIGCLAVLAHELPSLTLPISADTRDAYFDQCRLCNRGHGISLANQSQNTLIITCPHCGDAYNLIATDSKGKWRRANQFFGGMTSKAVTSEMTEMEKVMAIWGDVTKTCRYQLDAKRLYGGDSWDRPADTYRAGTGDCEDTSLLLVDMLTAHGLDARVALGKHEGEGHAWVVAKVDGRNYILESTWEDASRLTEPPTIGDVGVEYEPEYLFDRDSLYFLRGGGWTSDYWSPDYWTEVDYKDEVAAK